jgi:hypothetical protein
MWLWARYGQEYVPGWLGGKAVAQMMAKFDLTLVFTHQAMRLLASQQRNDPDEISSYRLFEADRAIALYFSLRKQAMDQARSRLSSIKPHAAAADG